MFATTAETVFMDVKMEHGVLPVNQRVPQTVMDSNVEGQLGIVSAVHLAIGEKDVKRGVRSFVMRRFVIKITVDVQKIVLMDTMVTHVILYVVLTVSIQNVNNKMEPALVAVSRTGWEISVTHAAENV